MTNRPFRVFAIPLLLAACSAEQSPVPNDASQEGASPANASTATANSLNTIHPAVTETPVPASNTLMLEGLGDLRIGQPVPARSTWKQTGAQASETCRTITSPEFPGVYAIVEEGKVRRITAGQRSTVKLAEKIGVGSSEEEVIKWFAGFRTDAHEYQAAPAKYLTAPTAPSGDSALRFEIGEDGKVSLIHVGTMPVLGYVEGCA